MTQHSRCKLRAKAEVNSASPFLSFPPYHILIWLAAGSKKSAKNFSAAIYLQCNRNFKINLLLNLFLFWKTDRLTEMWPVCLCDVLDLNHIWKHNCCLHKPSDTFMPQTNSCLKFLTSKLFMFVPLKFRKMCALSFNGLVFVFHMNKEKCVAKLLQKEALKQGWNDALRGNWWLSCLPHLWQVFICWPFMSD